MIVCLSSRHHTVAEMVSQPSEASSLNISQGRAGSLLMSQPVEAGSLLLSQGSAATQSYTINRSE